VIDGLPEAQPDRRDDRKGPKVGAPQKAMDGFLRSTGLTMEQLETQSGPKGDFYVAVIEESGRPTPEVIADIVPDVVKNFPWPKSQRWGEGTLRWVRPLHTVLCVYDGEVVDFSVEGIKSGRATRGHRFMAPDAFEVKDFEDYADKLKKAYVILDRDERKEIIENDAKQIAFASGLELVDDPALLDEVAGLVEWPVVLMGSFDKDFMEVPSEALTSAMRSHQKYFSLTDLKSGTMAPKFVVVSNMETADHGQKIVEGNERVLRARLADSKFFWDQDRQTKLIDRVDALSDMVFHARLGTVRDKVSRIEKLSGELSTRLGVNATQCARAALLAKADLTTEMVGEFPDLQGLMGQYYAIADGEEEAVAKAIPAHYAPQGPKDACPTDPVGVVVALSDKLDTLTGFWAIDEKPTGSKDPFALRRAALGVIRLILENKLRLKLLEVAKWAAERQVIDGKAGMKRKVDYKETADLLGFIADRLKVHLREQGTAHDHIDAIFALGGQDDLVLVIAQVDALKEFLGSEDGTNLLALYRRAANILSKEEKKDKRTFEPKPKKTLFEQDQERDLFAQLEEAGDAAQKAIAKEDFKAAMSAMSKLRAPVDTFFDKVTVNADDAKIRENRLALLSQVRAVLGSVADFSKIEG
jgi:glycyl-tRNA synthetase beta chain